MLQLHLLINHVNMFYKKIKSYIYLHFIGSYTCHVNMFYKGKKVKQLSLKLK